MSNAIIIALLIFIALILLFGKDKIKKLSKGMIMGILIGCSVGFIMMGIVWVILK